MEYRVNPKYLLGEIMSETKVINLEIPKDMDVHGTWEVMLRHFVENIVKWHDSENEYKSLNLEITPALDENGNVFVEIHEGIHTLFPWGVSTCVTTDADMNETLSILKNLILNRCDVRWNPKKEIVLNMDALKRYIETGDESLATYMIGAIESDIEENMEFLQKQKQELQGYIEKLEKLDVKE